jgi:hypothetical protein
MALNLFKRRPKPAESYASVLTARKRKADNAFSPDAIGSAIWALASEKLLQAQRAGATGAYTFQFSQGHDKIIVNGFCKSDDYKDGSFKFSSHMLLFPRSRKPLSFFMRALLALMGKKGFCSMMASRLFIDIAREEAETLLRLGYSFPSGAFSLAERDEIVHALPEPSRLAESRSAHARL